MQVLSGNELLIQKFGNITVAFTFKFLTLDLHTL